MNEKMKSAFSGRKAKVIGITLCAALILSVGTLTVLAASNENARPTAPFFESGEIAGGLAIRSDDDGIAYSADGGETWSDTAPESVSVSYSEDGISFSSIEIAVDADSFDSAEEMSYDLTAKAGGSEVFFENHYAEAFSTNPLEGFENRLSPESFQYIHMLRVEDGEIYHSLDGGETWIPGLPEGMIREGADEYTLSFDSEDGSVSFRHTVTVNIDD